MEAIRDFPSIENKVSISWHDIKIVAEAPKGCCGKVIQGSKDRTIINDINGSVLPGEFVSIIGASGAGKTTLLNYLSGRLISTGLQKYGTIKINGVDS
jgi:ABC-type multidrug transport system ATPase subunit